MAFLTSYLRTGRFRLPVIRDRVRRFWHMVRSLLRAIREQVSMDRSRRLAIRDRVAVYSQFSSSCLTILTAPGCRF